MYWTKKHVLVCTSNHCNQKGAMDVIGRLRLDVVRKKLDAEILVNNCGTIDLCDIGPNMVIYPDNIIYRGVTVKDIPEIVEYLKGGPVVERLVVTATAPEEQVRRTFYERLIAIEGGLEPSATDELVAACGLDAAFVAEQLRRGFMARKPDDDGVARCTATKKALDRYRLRT
ncbi:MAG: (2Fe-2S) ferredoxin domain-containing protein [Thermomicrobiales bacterium]